MLINSLLTDDPFGLGDKFGINIGPIASAASELGEIVSKLSSFVGQGISDSQNNPTNASRFAKDNVVDSGFQFADAAMLLSFASGNNVDLVTYTVPKTVVNSFDANPSVPLGVYSFFGILTLRPKIVAGMSFEQSYRFRTGVDSLGIFVDRDATGFKTEASAGPGISLEVDVVGVEVASGSVGATFSTEADLVLDAPNPKVRIGEIVNGFDASSASALGDWLSDTVRLDLRYSGDIVAGFGVFTPAGALINRLPDEVKELARPLLEELERRGISIDKLKQGINKIGGIITGDCKFHSPEKPIKCDERPADLGLALGDYLPLIDESPEGLESIQLM